MFQFTIVTPSFNQPDWLNLCIQSVRDQATGESDFSVQHIVQDAGTQGIDELAQRLGAAFFRDGTKVFDSPSHNKNYRLEIYSEKDAGMYDAVNRGFAKSTGEILAYLNCDEQYLPNALEKVANFFRLHQKTEILSAGCLVINEKGSLITARPGLIPWASHIYCSHLPIFTASLFYRKKVVQEKWRLFDTRYKDVGDAVWVLERLRERRHFAAAPFYSSAFTDTGENMNLLPNARKEAHYLKSTSPLLYSKTCPLIELMHRLRKLFLGSYFTKKYNYAIFTKDSPATRVDFEIQAQAGIWHSRLKVK